MRDPTPKEMVDGIAQGFRQYLNDRDPCSPVGSYGISDAIQKGIEAAMGEYLRKTGVSPAKPRTTEPT